MPWDEQLPTKALQVGDREGGFGCVFRSEVVPGYCENFEHARLLDNEEEHTLEQYLHEVVFESEVEVEEGPEGERLQVLGGAEDEPCAELAEVPVDKARLAVLPIGEQGKEGERSDLEGAGNHQQIQPPILAILRTKRVLHDRRGDDPLQRERFVQGV